MFPVLAISVLLGFWDGRLMRMTGHRYNCATDEYYLRYVGHERQSARARNR